MALFSGMKEAYGTYIIPKGDATPGKKVKGTGITKRGTVTLELWKEHLAGKQALGIIPIKADDSCVWGAIDVDDYSLDLVAFSKTIRTLKLPLIPMRTKSGGCHLCAFMKEPIPASDMKDKLAEIAASLGHGKAEIFPKQSHVLVDKGDMGNWLNMPYFGGNNSTRYGLDENGEAWSLEDFLKAAEKTRLTAEEFENIKVEIGAGVLEDGPPCLQILVTQGFPEGTRNNGLFNLGVYCRMGFPDQWEAQLEELNTKFMDPPLSSKEVRAIVKQLQKKDYTYKCSDQPLGNYCNNSLCRTRLHGIGGSSLPTMANLRKIPTDQPVWFLDVNGVTLELNTDQLQKQQLFQKACMDADNYMPPRINDRQWTTLIQALMDECKLRGILDKPKEAGLSDQFTELLHSFCADAHLKADEKDQLLLGRAWVGEHPQQADKKRVFFRLRDLQEFLIRHNFKYFNRSQIVSRLSSLDIQAQSHFFKIKGRGVNCWHIPELEDEQSESFSLPEMGEEVL